MDILLFPLRVLALLGFLSLAGGVIYLAFQALVYFVLKYQAAEAYRLWVLSLGEFRALVTLPMLSAFAAILASVGVNLLTQNGSREEFQSGLQFILIGVLMLLIFSFALAGSHRSESNDRALARRVGKISAGVDDPFVSFGSVRGLKSEVARYAKSGERHQGVAQSMSFRRWVRDCLNDKELSTLIVVAYAAPVATVTVVAGRLSREQMPSFVSWLVLVGCVCGLPAPALHFYNMRKRRELFGRFLASESRSILVKIDRLERMHGGHESSSSRPSKGHRSARPGFRGVYGKPRRRR
ncbi:hypothetical protein [Micromonospora saelicesensis]|uniref:hypothetical protein n=1 Tax=Micromonospora saelicesensis TaxID=285676 RepID=UPI0011BEDB18|nr:hypothetical protein [Micromonospora saelicesensis]